MRRKRSNMRRVARNSVVARASKSNWRATRLTQAKRKSK